MHEKQMDQLSLCLSLSSLSEVITIPKGLKKKTKKKKKKKTRTKSKARLNMKCPAVKTTKTHKITTDLGRSVA